MNFTGREKRMRQKVYRPMILVIVLTALLLSLSACGGKKNDDAASESAAAAPVEAAAALVGDPAAGEKVYQVSCVACHGPDARGVAGLGKSLHPEDSNFISERTDAELVEYIKVGRRVDDPLNTTGIDMPPKGGNPAMTEQEMYNVVAYMRTLDE
ncbi:MAG: cytochrome c [Caldilineaceae bacterium]|nr:cytochrome c [Caldilineaceae bacterium]MCB0069805.1 cytochrome c [Caldilineaceae bacterium]